VSSVARACLVQYEGIFVQEHVWSLVRTKGQMDKVMQAVERDRGPVLYTWSIRNCATSCAIIAGACSCPVSACSTRR
jgi:Uncharacterized protein conserved in bacteria